MFDDYPPLELLKTVEARVPCGCEMMEDIHCANGQEDMDSWPEWCYAPLAAAVCVALFEGDLGCKNPEEIMEWAFSLGEKLFAVAPWKRRKTVYMLEPALVDYVLKNRVILARVPSMDLVHLPCASFYLQVDFLGTDKYPVHGAFVTLECDPGTERKYCSCTTMTRGVPMRLKWESGPCLAPYRQCWMRGRNRQTASGRPARRVSLGKSIIVRCESSWKGPCSLRFSFAY